MPRQKKPGTKSNNYFNDDVRLAIREYIELKDVNQKKRDFIYAKRIHPAFFMMSQCLIRMFHLRPSQHETLDELILDCVAHMSVALDKYNVKREEASAEHPKAVNSFSFFTKVVKNWIFCYMNKTKKNTKRGELLMSQEYLEAVNDDTDHAEIFNNNHDMVEQLEKARLCVRPNSPTDQLIDDALGLLQGDSSINVSAYMASASRSHKHYLIKEVAQVIKKVKKSQEIT